MTTNKKLERYILDKIKVFITAHKYAYQNTIYPPKDIKTKSLTMVYDVYTSYRANNPHDSIFIDIMLKKYIYISGIPLQNIDKCVFKKIHLKRDDSQYLVLYPWIGRMHISPTIKFPSQKRRTLLNIIKNYYLLYPDDIDDLIYLSLNLL